MLTEEAENVKTLQQKNGDGQQAHFDQKSLR